MGDLRVSTPPSLPYPIFEYPGPPFQFQSWIWPPRSMGPSRLREQDRTPEQNDAVRWSRGAYEVSLTHGALYTGYQTRRR